MSKEFDPALNRVEAADGLQPPTASSLKSTRGSPGVVSERRGGIAAVADSRPDTSIGRELRGSAIASAVCAPAREGSLRAGLETEDSAKTKAEALGQLYRLTGAGS